MPVVRPQSEETSDETRPAVVVPFIARIAGLPAEWLTGLRSEDCTRLAEDIHALTATCDRLRAQTVDALFEALPTAPKERRRDLLAFKRDCHNDRLDRWDDRDLSWLAPWTGGLHADLWEARRKLDDARERFDTAYREARDAARETLIGVARDPALRRGLALASRHLLAAVPRLEKKPWARYGRKERGAEQSLVRYLCRATVKLSPYSTLTRVGLGAAVNEAISQIRMLDRPWREVSLVQVPAALSDHWIQLLMRVPELRERMALQLNRAGIRREDGRVRLLRPGRLVRGEDGVYTFSWPSWVMVGLGGPVVAWLEARPPDADWSYPAVRDAIATDLGADRDTVDGVLGQLVEVGLLELRPPWASHAPHPEQRILEFLEQGVPDSLEPTRDLLAGLVEEQGRYGETTEPAPALARLDERATELSETLRAVALPDGEARLATTGCNEDVLVHHPDDPRSRHGEVLQVSAADMDELRRTGDLLWRLREPEHARWELLPAVHHLVTRRWPGRDRIPVLEVFAAAEGLWKDFVRHHGPDDSHGSDAAAPFDPFGLPEVTRLTELRNALRHGVAEALTPEGDILRLPTDRLRDLVESLPARYRSPEGAGLLLQPADADGDLWVVNHLTPGTGATGSRFTPLLDPELREWMIPHLVERSTVSRHGEEALWLDLLYSRAATVGRHRPQTFKVLEMPGEWVDLPAERVERLHDLHVHPGPDRGLDVRNEAGRLHLPCFLSAIHAGFLPPVLKFLHALGSGHRGRLDLPVPSEEIPGAVVTPRVLVGRLVVRRKRWVCAPDAVPQGSADDAEGFLALQRFQRELGLPDQVYVRERLDRKVNLDVFKPQLVDFRSPTLVSVLAGVLRTMAGEPITFEEALPTPDAFPKESSGARRGVELTLESPAFD